MNDERVERTTLPISELHQHPLQQLYYPPETASNDEELRADIQAHGLRERVVVLPRNDQADLTGWTVLDGHRRVEACRQLGWETIDVIVRHDLVDAEAEAVEREFLSYNAQRRQLHMLDRARVALRLYQIEVGRSRGDLRPHEEPEARDRVAQRLGMSGRSLSRYWRVLRCPKPVQNALRDGRLQLALAEQIERLDESVQERLADRIAREADPQQVRAIVRGVIPRRTYDRGRPLWTAVRRLARDLDHALQVLEDRVEPLADFELARHAQVFARGRELVGALAEKAANPGRTPDEVYREMARRLEGTGPDELEG